MADHILELLGAQSLREEVFKALDELLTAANRIYDRDDDDNLLDWDEDDLLTLDCRCRRGQSDWERALTLASYYGGPADIRWCLAEAFRKHVIEKLPRPHCVTAFELSRALLDLAIPADETHGLFACQQRDLRTVYGLFLNWVANGLLRHRASEPFQVCTLPRDDSAFITGLMCGYLVSQGQSDRAMEIVESQRDVNETLLWEKNSIRLCASINESPPNQRFPGGERILYARVQGRMSQCACDNLHKELPRVLVSAIRSALLLAEVAPGGDQPDAMREPIPLVGDAKLFVRDPTAGEPSPIWECLDTYFWEPEQRDRKPEKELSMCIKNAIRLLVVSDDQTETDRFLSIALCIAAVEALLGRKDGDGIAASIGRRIGRLFEPEVKNRQYAEKFFKKIYGCRSDILHGREIQQTAATWKQVRHLAASVLHAIMQLRRWRRSTGDPIERDKLLTELHDCFVGEAGIPDGLPPYSVRKYWESENSPANSDVS